MSELKTFRVDYQTGHSWGFIIVNVGNFFGKTNLRDIDKLLRLAKIHCTTEQQVTLLMDLEEEKQGRNETQRIRIDKCIKRIKAQTWGKTC